MNQIFDDPELMAQLSEMGVFGDQMDLLSQQMGRAQALRNTPSPGGREVRGIYVAGNPLEHLSAGLSGVMGQRQTNATAGEQKALLERMRANARALAMALRDQGQQPMQPDMMTPPVEY